MSAFNSIYCNYCCVVTAFHSSHLDGPAFHLVVYGALRFLLPMEENLKTFFDLVTIMRTKKKKEKPTDLVK